MQLAALLRFPCWLTSVGCYTPAVMVSHGVGSCLVTVVLFPPCFSFLCLRSFPFRGFPFEVLPPYEWIGMCLQLADLLLGLAWRGLAASSSSGPAAYAVLPWGWFAGLILLRLLAGLCGLCTLCQGAPVAVLSAGFAGGVPLLPFLSLRVGVLLAEVSPEFVGCEGGFGCPSWFVILFLCLLILHHFLELGWFLVTVWWPLLRLLVLDSSDALLHPPDTLASASTPISDSWMVQAFAFS